MWFLGQEDGKISCALQKTSGRVCSNRGLQGKPTVLILIKWLSSLGGVTGPQGKMHGASEVHVTCPAPQGQDSFRHTLSPASQSPSANTGIQCNHSKLKLISSPYIKTKGKRKERRECKPLGQVTLTTLLILLRLYVPGKRLSPTIILKHTHSNASSLSRKVPHLAQADLDAPSCFNQQENRQQLFNLCQGFQLQIRE